MFKNNNFIIDNMYSVSPYMYITKKYFLKKKKIKYKKFKRILLKNIYSELYSHKVYSLNYYINFFKGLNTIKLSKFDAYQFYFFNFSGLLKQFLIKDMLMYSIIWRKLKNNSLTFKSNSYFYNKFSANISSNFILSSNSKYHIKVYHTNYLRKINYYKNNLLILEKNEYFKNMNYNNLIFLNSSFENNVNLKFNFVEKNNSLNLYYKRWWKGLWNYDLINISVNNQLERKLFFKILEIIIIKNFIKNNLFNPLILNYVLFKAYTMMFIKK